MLRNNFLYNLEVDTGCHLPNSLMLNDEEKT